MRMLRPDRHRTHLTLLTRRKLLPHPTGKPTQHRNRIHQSAACPWRVPGASATASRGLPSWDRDLPASAVRQQRQRLQRRCADGCERPAGQAYVVPAGAPRTGECVALQRAVLQGRRADRAVVAVGNERAVQVGDQHFELGDDELLQLTRCGDRGRPGASLRCPDRRGTARSSAASASSRRPCPRRRRRLPRERRPGRRSPRSAGPSRSTRDTRRSCPAAGDGRRRPRRSRDSRCHRRATPGTGGRCRARRWIRVATSSGCRSCSSSMPATRSSVEQVADLGLVQPRQ